jgi:hypothetical protein
MSAWSTAQTVARLLGSTLRSPGIAVQHLKGLPERIRGAHFSRQWMTPGTMVESHAVAQASSRSNLANGTSSVQRVEAAHNPLRLHFDNVRQGPGVWKWLHYFDLYHRHLARFVGRDVNVVEIGVYSGGSLAMWHKYFGGRCHVHGVDIQPECRAYADAHTTIHIGDQGDRAFWRQFRAAAPALDVVIDDGGHQPEQQMVTLEELLPHLRPGGVFICEDVHKAGNRFAAFTHALADALNAYAPSSSHGLTSQPRPFQSVIESVHHYPFAVVIEKRETVLGSFAAPKHGTQWQPFLDRPREPARGAA